jgi:Domain of unknown function (DUF4365)
MTTASACLMKRPLTHQTDEMARRIFRGALPPVWVVNGHKTDYGKDYHVEIAEPGGELAGTSFYVQLKGQGKSRLDAGGDRLRFILESRHARYYHDKVLDLPVFLVVADVAAGRAWWLFLQPALRKDQAWRRQKSVTITIPLGNELADTAKLRGAVEAANRWMRLQHPVAVTESIEAATQRIRDTDPRFDAKLQMSDHGPLFQLLPKEPINLRFAIKGEASRIADKVRELDRGLLVTFEPGELQIEGSALFAQAETDGCRLQTAVDQHGTVTVVSRDATGAELGRLADVPGRLTGGRSELWFRGGLSGSPVEVEVGPLEPGASGTFRLGLAMDRWEGQPLRHLPYFDRIRGFYGNLASAAILLVEVQHLGNTIFRVTVPPEGGDLIPAVARYLETLRKARVVAERFGVNPAWTLAGFDKTSRDAAEEVYAIFFLAGHTEPAPRVELSATLDGTSLPANLMDGKEFTEMKIESDCTAPMLGEKLPLGRLVHEFTEMGPPRVLSPRTGRRTQRTRAPLWSFRGKGGGKVRGTGLKVVFTGSDQNSMSIRQAEPGTSARAIAR